MGPDLRIRSMGRLRARALPRLGTTLAVMLATAGCGTHAGFLPPAYQITAPLLSVRGGPVYACHAVLLSYPPAGCGGVLVHGVGIGQVPGVQRYTNGTLYTPTVRLVGTWDGQALAVTQPPQAAKLQTPVQQPNCQTGGAGLSPSSLALQQRVGQDQATLVQHGVAVLETVPCPSSTLYMLVAVADEATVSYLKSRYGPVEVAGWLQPA